MSLTQIKRNPKIRRMNQIPIYNILELENISIINRQEEIKEMVQSILYDMIDLIETNHNFEYVQFVEQPKKKNVFKRFMCATKKILHLS